VLQGHSTSEILRKIREGAHATGAKP